MYINIYIYIYIYIYVYTYFLAERAYDLSSDALTCDAPIQPFFVFRTFVLKIPESRP